MQKTNIETRSGIQPHILQQFMESALNPEAGQSQYFTPIPFGRKLAEALPLPRPILCDLTSGAGDLLQATANRTTTHLLGSDIDPCARKTPAGDTKPETPRLHVSKITRDLTRLFPRLVEIDWRADLFVLNPPFSLRWHRDRLTALANSECPAVRAAFAAHEDPSTGNCPREGIDSTVATLMMALDRCTLYGEGLLIANDATLERLIFADGAPHAALAKHIWLHLRSRGNPMTGDDRVNFQPDKVFYTGIIYFARDHSLGPKHVTVEEVTTDEATGAIDFGIGSLESFRTYRQGAELRNIHASTAETTELWQITKEQVAEEDGAQPKVPWNLWLANNRIQANLSRFESHSGKTDKKEAGRLFALRGKAPMELVLQRAQRDELQHVAGPGSIWKVHPDLVAAVQKAVTDYHAARAPLYPLPQIQRLGYLDEQDAIGCTKDLGTHFHAGESYPLRTQTVPVTRTVWKPNPFTGEDEKLEFTGQELALFIKTAPLSAPKDDAPEVCFMDAKLKADKRTKVGTADQQKVGRSSRLSIYAPKPEEQSIHHTLQELVAHFEIPEVPDVATVSPKGYENNLAHLEELEAILSA